MFYKNKKIVIDAVDRGSDAKINIVRKLLDHIPKNVLSYDMTKTGDKALMFTYIKIRTAAWIATEDRVKHAINSKI